MLERDWLSNREGTLYQSTNLNQHHQRRTPPAKLKVGLDLTGWMLQLLARSRRLPIVTFPSPPLLSSTQPVGIRRILSNRYIPSPRSASTMAASHDKEDWKSIVNPGVPSYSVFSRPVQISEQDDREYRVIRLGNGLEAMVVHDAKADKAAASLDVAVGHLNDPVSASFASSSP